MARVGGSLSISWCENGLVMTASMTENNKWSTPKKYIKGTMQENVRYNIQSETECFATYGYQQDGRIMLYITRNILEHPPKEQNEEPQKKQPTPIDTNSGAFVPRSVYAADMAALRKLLASQNDIIVEMLKKITALERTAFPSESIAEDDGQLDRLAAENARTEELRKNQIAHVDERSTPQL